MKAPALTTNLPSTLVLDIRTMVHEARASIAIAVNSGLTMLYWRIGKRINEDVLKGETGRIRQADCLHTVATIGAGVWDRLFRKESSAHDAIWGGIPG